MIPRGDSKRAGSGGGGQGKSAAHVPFFCKRCGKTMPGKKVQDSVDVCRKCSVRK